MKYRMPLLLSMFVISSGWSAVSAAQNVTAIKVTFKTTSDDKDWNSQVRDRVTLDGQDIATLFCCSADRHGDHWPDNGTTSAPMSIVKSVSKQDIHRASFVAGMTAVGHDKWNFIPTVTVTYSDGTHEQWTFAETFLSSNNNEMDQTYSMQ
jgi:hypothetical protein